VVLPRTDLSSGWPPWTGPIRGPEWRDFSTSASGARSPSSPIWSSVRCASTTTCAPFGTHGVLADKAFYHRNGMYVCAGGSEGSLDGYRAPFEFPKRAESIAMSFYHALLQPPCP